MLREKFFSKLSNLIIKRPKMVILTGIIITILMGFAASNVKMKLAFYEMLPKNIPEVESFFKIREDFGFASAENVIIESKDGNIEEMISCALELSDMISSLQMIVNKDTMQMVKRTEFKIDRSFMEKNSFLIQKTKDLDNTLNLFTSLGIKGFLKNLNDNFEKEYISDNDNISSLDSRQILLYSLNSIGNYIDGLFQFIKGEDKNHIEASIDELINGPRYYISPNGKLLLMKVVMADNIPNEYTLQYGAKLKEIFKDLKEKYPNLWFGATGDAIISTDTLESVEKDFGIPNIISIALIIFILLGAFGSWKDPFWALITLFLAIFWTVGFIGLTIKYLNLISIAFAILLIGLGIDFAIHLISGFQTARKDGAPVPDAIKDMFENRGTGIITGGLTTTFAFLALSVTDFSALREIGIASGMGIFFCMVVSLTIFPALLIWNHKGYSMASRFLMFCKLGFILNASSYISNIIKQLFPIKLRQSISVFFQFNFLEDIGKFTQKTIIASLILIISFSLTIYSILKIKNIEFEYNFMKLEAEGIMSEVSQEKILKSFEMSPDFTFLIADNLQQSRNFVNQLKLLNKKSGLIGRIDALTEFISDSLTQEKNIIKLNNFKGRLEKVDIKSLDINKSELVEELKRLHNNIVEIGELSVLNEGEDNALIKKCDQITGKSDSLSRILTLANYINGNSNLEPKLEQAQVIIASLMKELLLKKCVNSLVTLENIPEDIKTRYVSKNSDALLITVYSKGQIFDERILNQFSKELEKVSLTATGGPILLVRFLRMLIDKGAEATLFALIAIFVLLLIDFKSIIDTTIVVIPLLFAVSWLFGMIDVLGIKMNFNSLTIFPLIIGIGIDDGVHIMHRYKKEGIGSIPLVLKCTGRSIFLTSLTTAIAFGSMAFSVRRGISSAGLILAIGVMLCFITSVTLLPAILTLYEKMTKNR